MTCTADSTTTDTDHASTRFIRITL